MAHSSGFTGFLGQWGLQFTNEGAEVQGVNYNSKKKGHLLSAYFQADPVLSPLHILSHLILSTTLMRSGCY